jgi:hypothetical protein
MERNSGVRSWMEEAMAGSMGARGRGCECRMACARGVCAGEGEVAVTLLEGVGRV